MSSPCDGDHASPACEDRQCWRREHDLQCTFRRKLRMDENYCSCTVVHVVKDWTDEGCAVALCGDTSYKVAQSLQHYREFRKVYEHQHCAQCVEAAS